MAIQFMDNFKTYGGDINKMLDGLPWGSFYGSLATDPDPGSSGYVLRVENWAILALPTPSTQVGCGFRLYMPGLPSSGRQPQWGFSNNDGSAAYTWCVAPNGAIELHSGVGGIGGPLVASTVSPVLAPNSWFHIEFFNDFAAGTYECRVEGVTVLSGTSSTVYPAVSATRMSWASQGVSITFYVKDMIMWDKTGSVNNDFIGTVTIYNLPVNSDVSSGWTKSSGTSDYQLLDDGGDGTTVNDADYISAGFGPLPAASFMGMADLPSTVVTVKAVQTMVRAKKSDGGDANLVVSLKSGSSTGSGTTKAVTTAFKYWFDVQQLDPATGALWSPLAVNSAQIKIDRTL